LQAEIKSLEIRCADLNNEVKEVRKVVGFPVANLSQEAHIMKELIFLTHFINLLVFLFILCSTKEYMMLVYFNYRNVSG